jgi:hypothetical protein
MGPQAMSIYNPIASMQRLEAAGFKRAQAEALADELRDAISDLVTREFLKAELDRLLIRQSAACAAMLALAVTVSKIFA